MSFLTEYFDEYREHPIRKVKPCRPEDRFAKLEGKWLNTQAGKEEKERSSGEEKEFIKAAMRSLRGQSTYYNEYCAHLDQDFKYRQFVPRAKKRQPCKPRVEDQVEEAPSEPPLPKLAMKDTELMKDARDLYERDVNAPTLKPLDTHFRMLGYVRPCLYKTGVSEYQGGVARVAYELVRDQRVPEYRPHNGGRPRWGIPPQGVRQPPLDAAPFDGERLY